ncbi:MAG: S-methyl-5'-thioadenosine phosphorylase [Terrimicrobiaceae bacterium]|nr:S-methyl-5'-thioadenosine phosphorylase [Terrimicrobiaceae bacterium]
MAAIGVLGGTGLGSLPGFQAEEEAAVATPFGEPSAPLIIGNLGGRRVIFLARHGPGHRIAPHEINHRANLWALRMQGVRFLISISAVGSLREELEPGMAVLPSQFLDRMSRRDQHTFFDGGIVAHVGFADPVSPGLAGILAEACREAGARFAEGGVYVCMDGPAFSTRAESLAYRQLGGSVIGMTNLPEAKLAREAEIAFATLAMVTDYDCWKTDAPPVSTEEVLERVRGNAALALRILEAAIPRVPADPVWPEHRSLDTAFATPRGAWPPETRARLAPILEGFLARNPEA